MKNKKIGLVTWHYYSNFGSALQAYALQKNIVELGYDVKIINYRNKKYGKYTKSANIKNFVRCIVEKIFRGKNNKIAQKLYNPFLIFRNRFFNETKVEQDEEKLWKLCRDCKTVVCGSDQIWAPNVFNSVYMLDFVPNNINKVSYAASVGLNDIKDSMAKKYKLLLDDFKHISVREQAGAKLLKEKCQVDACVVLDPTLLLDKKHWQILEKECLKEDENYIFCYFLNEKNEYKDKVLAYAKENGLNIIGKSANPDDEVWLSSPPNQIGPQEFLKLIHNARVIFTDSYHGTIFSLLYHKDFVTFERFENTDEVCQNSRIYQLNRYFDISKRIVRLLDCEKLTIAEYDYNKFEERLKVLRQESLEFLKNALEG